MPTAGEHPKIQSVFVRAHSRRHPHREEIMTRRTTFMLTSMALLGLAVAALPQAGLAQSDPGIGTWKLNLAKSTYSPGPPPRSQTITTQAEGQAHKYTVEAVDAQGNPSKAVVMTFNDGKSHPVTGVPAYDAASDKRVNDSTAWVIRTKAGKVVQTLIGEYSADGKTWTITTAGVTQNGQQLYNVTVYDKQ
jgi:hypothetical protein